MKLVLLRLAAAGMLIILATGCKTPAANLESTAIQQIQKGSSMAEVRQLFGQPKVTLLGSNGRTLDRYQIFFLKDRGSQQSMRTLEFRTLYTLYDKDKRLEDFVYSVGHLTGSVAPNRQWQAGKPVAEFNLGAIARGVTTRQSMIDMFGPPVEETLNVNGQRGMRWLFGAGSLSSGEKNQSLEVVFAPTYEVLDFRVRDDVP